MKKIFTPCKIGKLNIANRFVMTACNLGWCEGGYIGKDVVNFYANRAKGGVGLIIAGAAGVDPESVNTVGMMQAYDDRFIPGLSDLAAAVHDNNGKIMLQLMHAGAYARRDEHDGVQAVAPSSYKSMFTGEVTRELSIDEIIKIEDDFAQAALRAKMAGLDGVEIIGSAGYLAAEFISKAVNKRSDEYGGSIENRCRLILNILKKIKDICGRDFPVVVRLSGSDFIPDGNGTEEFIQTAKLIAASENADALDITGGWHESRVPQITFNVPSGMYTYFSAALKGQLDIPVIGCNRMGPQEAAEAVENGYCDMAGMLRAHIADPRLCSSYKEGKLIRPCLYCNQECLEKIFSKKRLSCVVNPLVGTKEEDPEYHDYRQMGKSILVIGGGPAGLTYAALASEMNNVAVWEKRMHHGGCAKAVSAIPYREDVKKYLDYLYERCLSNDVEFKFGKQTDRAEMEKIIVSGAYDKVVLATGAMRKACEFETAEDLKIWSPSDYILSGINPSDNTVIIGSTYHAVQTALYISGRYDGQSRIKRSFLEKYAPDQLELYDSISAKKPRNITLIGNLPGAGGGFGKSTKHLMLKEMKDSGISYISAESILWANEKGIYYRRKDTEEGFIPADTIINCSGSASDMEALELADSYPLKVTVIGDARAPARISEAVKAGYNEALNINHLFTKGEQHGTEKQIGRESSTGNRSSQRTWQRVRTQAGRAWG